MRIISLVPSVTETLFELGLGEQIVAVSRFCWLPQEGVRSKTKIGGTKNPKLEKIAALNPDVVIMNEEENRKEDAEALARRGIRLFVTFPNNIVQSMQMVLDLGDLFDVRDRAEKMAEEIQALMKQWKSASQQPTLILIWRHPYMTIGPNTYVDNVCRFFGFRNAFENAGDRYPKPSDDAIHTSEPEVVLFPDEPYPFREKHIDEFRKQFPGLPAVRNNRLFLVNGTYLTWHGFGTLRTLREFPSVIRGWQL